MGFPIASDDQKLLIAQLNSTPGWGALRAWSHEVRDQYLVNLAQSLWRDPDKVTEASLREKAMFFKGMNTVLNQPFFSMAALKRAIEQSDEEG